jgi:hypothetical protein
MMFYRVVFTGGLYMVWGLSIPIRGADMHRLATPIRWNSHEPPVLIYIMDKLLDMSCYGKCYKHVIFGRVILIIRDYVSGPIIQSTLCNV